MNSTVLITGGSGLLALNWASAIRDRHSVILGLHEKRTALAGTLNHTVDLDSVESFTRALDTIEPDFVVHTAGLTSVEGCEAKPDLAHYVNVDLAANVARACAKVGLPMVHISTDHLFTGKAQQVDETHPVAPMNVYGQTKAEAEARVLEKHSQVLVIRTNFYGWGTSYRRSFSDLIVDALRSGKELTLFQDVFYTPILIETAAEAVHELVALGAHGIFNIVGSQRISKHRFGMVLAEQFGLDPSPIRAVNLADRTQLVRRPLDMSLSNEKAIRRLGHRFGDINKDLQRLVRQEKQGLAAEMRNL